MPRSFLVLLVVAALAAFARDAASQTTVLTLDAALARARECAPDIVSARAAIREARGRLLGSSALLRDNPSLTATLGHRRRPGEQVEDRLFGLSQNIELGGKRGARM